MVLYDKNFKPIGISQDILNFLGYEDMDDFKTYATDIADLFVQKSGYIYKFENFSWIKYILHSGAPNKSALIKLKHGKEREIQLSIKELFLFEEGNDDLYYEVNIINNFLQDELKDSIPLPINPILSITEEDSKDKPKSKMLDQEEQPKIVKNDKFTTTKKHQTIKPVIKRPKPIETSSEDMFIEDLSEENLPFLKAHELPPIEKRDMQEKKIDYQKSESFLGLQEEGVKEFIEEFLNYNDSIGLEMLNAVTQKELQSVKKYTINLESIAKMLQLNKLSANLEALKNSNSNNIQKAFEEYQETLEELRGIL